MRYDDAMATKPKTKDKKLGWHFLPADMKLGYGDNRKAAVGQTLSLTNKSKVDCCYNGLHASEKIHNAASFGKGPVLCRVEVSGEINTKGNKFCGRNRKVLWARKLTTKEMRALLDHIGWGSNLGDDEDSLVQSMDSAAGSYPDELDNWLEAWAKKNGCIPGKYASPAPEYVQPSVTEKCILALISRRMVRTAKEIRADLTVFDCGNFDTIMDDLCSDGKVLQVNDYTKNGMDGYVLAPTSR
jgi:hypothetical protein